MSTDGTNVVSARAVVAAVTRVARNSDDAANDTFFAKEHVDLAAALGLLPPGVPLEAIGRSAIVVGTHHWTDAGLGARQDIRFRAPIWTYQLLYWADRERLDDPEHVPHLVDVPVWAEPDTGRIVAVDVDRMIAELTPQFDRAKRIWKQDEAPLAAVRTVIKAPKLAGGLLRRIKAEVADVVSDIKGIGDGGAPPLHLGDRPTDTDAPPIEGIGYRQWLEVKGGLARDEVRPEHREVYVTHRAIPAGRWDTIDAAWQQRVAADPRMAAWRDFDLGYLSQLGGRWLDVG